MKFNNIVFPDYDHCILGIVNSLLRYYNADTTYKPCKKLDEHLNKRYKNVIFLVLDGLGNNLLNSISPNGFFNKNKIDTLTSVYPSTTTAALNSYYSALSPYETGWIAWSQYFKEYGRAIDMFSRKESYLGEDIKEPLMDIYETLLKYETIYEKIEKSYKGIKMYALEPHYSTKKTMQTLISDNIDEIIVNIKDLCTNPQEKFIFAYCENPDSLLHKYGTTSNEVREFVISTEKKLEELNKTFDKDTILIISADHGHKDIKKAYTLNDYPKIRECLIMPESLESRALTFFVKEEMKQEFETRFNEVFKNEFWLLTKDEFLNKYHFLGYGKNIPK